MQITPINFIQYFLASWIGNKSIRGLCLLHLFDCFGHGLYVTDVEGFINMLCYIRAVN